MVRPILPTYYHTLLTTCPEILDFGYPQNTDTDTLKM